MQKADKGNTVVILNRKHYACKIKYILNDKSRFQKVYIDHEKILNNLIHMENRVTEVLKNLRDKKEISIEQYKDLNPSGSRPGIMYGSAKNHKIVTDGLPSFRPILSTIGTPTYKLEKFLIQMLGPLTTNEYNIKNSFTYAEKLQSSHSKLVMASSDIESLFTNIPLQETIDVSVENLFKDVDVDNLSKDSFRELLTSTMSETLILFDQEFYKQHDGVATGSPLGPTLANVFLCYREKIWFQNCPSDLNLLSMEGTLIIHSYFFARNITSKNFEIIQNVNIKILDSLFTNFGSFIPESYKYNLLFTLIHRAFKLCPNFEVFNQKIDKLKIIFENNGYPKGFVEVCIKKYLDKVLKTSKKELICVLPFIGNKSLQLV